MYAKTKSLAFPRKALEIKSFVLTKCFCFASGLQNTKVLIQIPSWFFKNKKHSQKFFRKKTWNITSNLMIIREVLKAKEICYWTLNLKLLTSGFEKLTAEKKPFSKVYQNFGNPQGNWSRIWKIPNVMVVKRILHTPCCHAFTRNLKVLLGAQSKNFVYICFFLKRKDFEENRLKSPSSKYLMRSCPEKSKVTTRYYKQTKDTGHQNFFMHNYPNILQHLHVTRIHVSSMAHFPVNFYFKVHIRVD